MIAKFRVSRVEDNGYTTREGVYVKHSETLYMHPVCGPENLEWAKATPGGSVVLTIENKDLFGKHPVDSHYLTTFQQVEK